MGQAGVSPVEGFRMTGVGEQSLSWFGRDRVDAADVAAPDLTVLVHAYSGLLYRVAMSILRNGAEAEDVVQDTFVRVLQKRDELSAVREMRPWLVRIAWNLALDRKRRIKPDQMDEIFAGALVGRERPADEALAGSRRMQAVLAEIERLPAAERDALLLSAVEELSAAEIGAVLGRTDSSVRALMFRARTRLRQRLAKGGAA
jgi:RNA polymerase sigma-70 factor (ECF subfamily)